MSETASSTSDETPVRRERPVRSTRSRPVKKDENENIALKNPTKTETPQSTNNKVLKVVLRELFSNVDERINGDQVSITNGNQSTNKKVLKVVLRELFSNVDERINGDQVSITNGNQSVENKNKRKLEAVDTASESSSEPPVTKRRRGAPKKAVKEELQQKERMRCIQHFVQISMKYSQHLEKKIHKKISKTSNIEQNQGTGRSERTTLTTKNALRISQKMKYFEGGTLRPYQLEGVIWLTVLFENSFNGILADEMGLGKTIQVIALICHLYERKVKGPFLIVAPLSTLGNWESEFAKFAPKIPVLRVQGSAQHRREQMSIIYSKKFAIEGTAIKPVILTSYQVPMMEHKFFSQFKWQYIIVDEGHRIKNPESQLSVELRCLKSHNRLLLTGTPLQNNIRELWALFNFLMPDLFKDIESSSQVILLEDVESKEKVLENEAQTKIISTIHKVLSPFMLRREKASVLTDLVPKKEVIIYCTMTKLQKYLYRIILQRKFEKLMMRPPKKEVSKTRGRRKCASRPIRYREVSKIGYFEEESQPQESSSTQSNCIMTSEHVPVKMPRYTYYCRVAMQNIFMMLKKAVNHPYLIWQPFDPKTNELMVSEEIVKASGKMKILNVLLPKLKSRGHKVLIFSTSVIFLNLVEELLKMRGMKFARLDGSTDFDDRNTNIGDFQNDPDVSFFLLSTRAGGLGLNLTAADTVIFLDRDWNPMADRQAQDRCHRIGQTRPVMVYSLICKNTIDERILDVGTKKRRLEKLVIKEGQFKTLQRHNRDLEAELKDLEKLFNKEDSAVTKVNSNGLVYSNSEIEQILDRSELYEKMEQIQAK